MKFYSCMRAVLCSFLVVAAVAAFAVDPPSGQPISILYAGSMSSVVQKGLGPAFTKATGIKIQAQAVPSLAAAQVIRDRSKKPDLFLSSDREINLQTLMFPPNGSRVKWYLSLAASELVVAYSPRSSFAAQFKDGAAAGLD